MRFFSPSFPLFFSFLLPLELLATSVAIYSLGQLISSFSFGQWINKSSAKEVLYASLGIGFVGGFMYGTAQSGIEVVISRLLIGIYTGGNEVAHRTFVSKYTNCDERTVVMSAVSTATVLGFLSGPALSAITSFVDTGPYYIGPVLFRVDAYRGPGYLVILSTLCSLYLVTYHLNDPDFNRRWKKAPQCQLRNKDLTMASIPAAENDGDDDVMFGLSRTEKSPLMKHTHTHNSSTTTTNTNNYYITTHHQYDQDDHDQCHDGDHTEKKEKTVHSYGSITGSITGTMTQRTAHHRSNDITELTTIGELSDFMKPIECPPCTDDIILFFDDDTVLSNLPSDLLPICICGLSLFVTACGFSAYETVTTPLVQKDFGWDVTDANVLFLAAGLVSILSYLIIKSVAKYVEDRGIQLFGLLLSVMGYGLLTTIDGTKLSITRFCVGFAMCNMAVEIIRSTGFSIASKVAGPSSVPTLDGSTPKGKIEQGTLMGVLIVCNSLARMVGPYTSVMLWDMAGREGGSHVNYLYGSLALMFACCSVVSVYYYDRMIPHPALRTVKM